MLFDLGNSSFMYNTLIKQYIWLWFLSVFLITFSSVIFLDNALSVPSHANAFHNNEDVHLLNGRKPEVINVAVCFIRWSNSYELMPQLRTQLENQFKNTTALYNEMTSGNILLNFDLIDPGNVWNGPKPKPFHDEIGYAVSACGSYIDFDHIDAFVLYPSVFNGPLGSLGEYKKLSTPQGDKTMAVIRLAGYDVYKDKLYKGFSSLPHELGHALKNTRFNHANRYNCKEGGIEVSYSPETTNCSIEEYGNTFDLMGGGIGLGTGIGDDQIERQYGSMGGFEKSLAGLIQVTEVQDGGIYPLEAIEKSDSNLPQLLKVVYKDLPLCIEHRKPIGPDRIFTYENINAITGIQAGLPPEGCLFLSICSNDPSTFNNYDFALGRNSNFLINPTPNAVQGPNSYVMNKFIGCMPSSGFPLDPNLGIGVTYVPSMNSPDAVMVNVTGIDKARLASEPNLKILIDYERVDSPPGKHIHIQNVSQTGQNITTPFDVVTYGQKKSDGQYETIATQTVPQLPIFSNIAIDFSPNQLSDLAKQFSSLKIIVDPENVIQETYEDDNTVVFSIP